MPAPDGAGHGAAPRADGAVGREQAEVEAELVVARAELRQRLLACAGANAPSVDLFAGK